MRIQTLTLLAVFLSFAGWRLNLVICSVSFVKFCHLVPIHLLYGHKNHYHRCPCWHAREAKDITEPQNDCNWKRPLEVL